jgi:hypothetical protein
VVDSPDCEAFISYAATDHCGGWVPPFEILVESVKIHSRYVSERRLRWSRVQLVCSSHKIRNSPHGRRWGV